MRAIADIDWDSWTPTMRGTLLWVLQDGKALVIRKKRGMGVGLINAPGGKIDPGETAKEAAERELTEEVGVRAVGTRFCGELYFQFVEGLRLHVHVFAAAEYTGTPIETDEALPMWVDQHAMPYDEMWADDQYWVPHLLAGRWFLLRALFTEDQVLLDHTLEVGERPR